MQQQQPGVLHPQNPLSGLQRTDVRNLFVCTRGPRCQPPHGLRGGGGWKKGGRMGKTEVGGGLYVVM